MSELNVIVGMGESGLSCAHFLNNQGMPFTIMDTRPNPPGLLSFKKFFPDKQCILGELNEKILSGASTIILSPGISKQTPAIQKTISKGIDVIGDIELFARHINADVIAITGTNAKSTVTTLVGKMVKHAGLNVCVGGNLGIPALSLLNAKANTNLYVLELSSFQLETTYSLKPKVATVLNVTEDHMDRYKNMNDYRAAKLRVYQNTNVAVCNRDDPLTECEHDKKLYFTLNEPNINEFGIKRISGETFLMYGDQPLLATKEMPIDGRHYYANALAALAIGFGFGLPFSPMLEVLREFTGLPHRCQFIREINGIKWYNDSKGTNVGATLAAISGLGPEVNGKLVLIAGGLGKNASFEPLLPALIKHVRHAILIGEAANEMASVIGNKLPVSFAKTMKEAILSAFSIAQAGDGVLLSPACASYDMFKNFEERGLIYTELVNQLS